MLAGRVLSGMDVLLNGSSLFEGEGPCLEFLSGFEVFTMKGLLPKLNEPKTGVRLVKVPKLDLTGDPQHLLGFE